jgi:hypothetical protein
MSASRKATTIVAVDTRTIQRRIRARMLELPPSGTGLDPPRDSLT